MDKRLAEGGVIFLHDTEPDFCNSIGPRYLLEKLGAQVAEDYYFIQLPTGDGYGLAILQKKSDIAAQNWKPALKDLMIERLSYQIRALKEKR